MNVTLKLALTAILFVLPAGSFAGTLIGPAFDQDSWNLQVDPSGAAATLTQEPAPAGDTSFNLLLPTADPYSWSFEHPNDGASKITAESGALKIYVAKADGVSWHFQVNQNYIPLNEGQTYTLKFRAKADAARSISVGTMVVGDDWHGVGLGQDIALTTDWQPFTMTFVASKVAPADNRLNIAVGQQAGSVWIADMELTPKTPVATSAPASAVKVSVSKIDDTDWHIILASKPLDIIDGKSYVISFKGRANESHPVSVTAKIDAGDYHYLGTFDTSCVFGPAWKTFAMKFTSKGAAPNHNVISISFGSRVGDVWLGDIQVSEVQ